MSVLGPLGPDGLPHKRSSWEEVRQSFDSLRQKKALHELRMKDCYRALNICGIQGKPMTGTLMLQMLN